MREPRRSFSFFKSTHFGIALWYTALIGVVAVAFGVFIYVSQIRDFDGESRFRLTRKIEDAARALGNGYAVPAEEDDAYAVFDADGNVQAVRGLTAEAATALAKRASIPSSGAPTFDAPARHGRPTAWATDTRDGGMLYGYIALWGPKGRQSEASGAILFGSPLDPYGLRGRLLLTILIAVAVMLGLAALSGVWLVSRAMRPVAVIARTARSIGEGDLSRRIRLGTRDELGELADVFDAMLDRLQGAFERQKRFVADAGHELRTPLSIISLESDRALAATRSVAEYRGSLEIVRTESRFMSKLVDDLLFLARSDSGGARGQRERMDLCDVVVDAMDRFVQLAGEARLALVAGSLAPAPVVGDRTTLVAMVSNLLDNAVKYTRGRGSRIVASVEADVAHRLAIVRVSDDGPGIPPDKLDHVFERFYRVDEARSDIDGVPQGSGLGLAIVKTIAESHGGAARAESTPGQGCSFAVSLPLAP